MTMEMGEEIGVEVIVIGVAVGREGIGKARVMRKRTEVGAVNRGMKVEIQKVEATRGKVVGKKSEAQVTRTEMRVRGGLSMIGARV